GVELIGQRVDAAIIRVEIRLERAVAERDLWDAERKRPGDGREHRESQHGGAQQKCPPGTPRLHAESPCGDGPARGRAVRYSSSRLGGGVLILSPCLAVRRAEKPVRCH